MFVIDEKAHARFKRDGNNLIYNAKLSLADALCGTTLSIPNLDGRTTSVPLRDVVSSGSQQAARGEGMPVSKAPGSRGDLIIQFQVEFPRRLDDTVKQQLRALLS